MEFREPMIVESKNPMEKARRQIQAMIFRQKAGPGQELRFRDFSKEWEMSKTPIMHAWESPYFASDENRFWQEGLAGELSRVKESWGNHRTG